MANKKDHPDHHSILYIDKKDWFKDSYANLYGGGKSDGWERGVIVEWRNREAINTFWEVIREKMKNKDCDFSDVHFPIFTEENFWKKGEEKIFISSVDFRNAKFYGNINLKNVQFPVSTKFSCAQFYGHANFSNAKLSIFTHFSETQFLGYADFSDTQFSGHTDFSNSKFSRDANLLSTRFSRSADFRNVQFSMVANFTNAQFSKKANFTKATFKQKLFFQASDIRTKEEKDIGSPYLKEIIFERATFGGTADFSNRIFTEHTSFREATFREAPIFHNAELHQDTDFGRTVFDKSCFKNERASEHFRTLKLAMESKRARREEMMFYAYEQRSLRHENRQIHKKLRPHHTTYWRLSAEIIFSLLYQWVSDYGRSYIRALVWLVGVYLAFAGLYWGTDVSMAQAMELSVLQFVRPFYIWSDTTCSLSTKWVATLETVLGLVIFYLFLQAIQRQFKMR